MAVTARFKVGRITPYSTDDDGNVTAGEIEMVPDYAQGRNSEWASATPSGVFRMNVTNPPVFEQLKSGTSLHILITPVED